MTLTVELPNDLAQHEDPAREALEAVAIEAYRTGSLTHAEAADLLHFGRLEFEELLKRKGVTEGAYDLEDFMQDVKTGDLLRAAGLIPG